MSNDTLPVALKSIHGELKKLVEHIDEIDRDKFRARGQNPKFREFQQWERAVRDAVEALEEWCPDPENQFGLEVPLKG